MSTRRVPAIDGWFTMPTDGSAPALIGTRDTTTGTYFFPPERASSRAPGGADAELVDVELSRTGRLWSYTDAGYRPPEPYVPVTDPHVPFAIAAVELAEEKMVVMGQVVAGVAVDDLSVGMEMELVLDTLYSEPDPDGADGDVVEHVVWKWRPVGGTAAAGAVSAGEPS